MLKRGIALTLLLTGLIATPSFAQSMQFDPSSGTPFTETQFDPQSNATNQTLQFQANQIQSRYVNPYDVSHAQMQNGLPPTTMDSFVYNAGGLAESIYGDEGTTDIPPYFGFDPSHRINLGIASSPSGPGLTTGHGSSLPSAWGGDEFDMSEPWSQAGSSMYQSSVILPLPVYQAQQNVLQTVQEAQMLLNAFAY